MSEKAKFVLGISLGLTLFILLIIGFVILYILIKKRMKLKLAKHFMIDYKMNF